MSSVVQKLEGSNAPKREHAGSCDCNNNNDTTLPWPSRRIHQALLPPKTVTRHAGREYTCDCLETRPSHTLSQAAAQVSSTSIGKPCPRKSQKAVE